VLKHLGLRLFLTLGLLLICFELLVFTQNTRAADRIRVKIVEADLQWMLRSGDLERCDADPAAWEAPLSGLGMVYTLDESGRPHNPQAPLQQAFANDVEPGQLVKQGAKVHWLGWTGVYALARQAAEAPCRSFLIVQRHMMGVDTHLFWWIALPRFVLGLAIVCLTWWFVVRPLLQRIHVLAGRTSTIVEADFEGQLPVGRGDEIDQLAVAFNRAAAAARERLERLRKQDKLTREVMANIAHDVRTPLAALKLGTGRLLADQPQSEVGPTVRSELNYLDSLIANLGTLVQLEGTTLPLVRQKLDACALVNRCLARFEMVAAGRGVEINGATPDDPLHFAGDPLAVEQALGNLVQNATDFASGNVALVCFEEQGSVVFSVQDDGPGLEIGEIPRLSERSYRGIASHSRGRKGLGLGLAIADEVARRHGGELIFDCPAEGGTRIRLRFPRGLSLRMDTYHWE